MPESDHLSNEVSLSARLDDKGLAGSVKSRAVAALDRLVGSVLDIPTAYLERHAQQVRNRPLSSHLPHLIEALGEQVANRVVKDALRKQENREAIAENTIGYLRNLSEDDDSGENSYATEIAQDWINVFEAHAERASSEKLRDLWGRVLAGEIRKPRSFSLTTIRFISELDAEIADKFQSLVQIRIPDGFILKPRDLRGNVLRDLMFLEELGLIQGVHGSLNRRLSVSGDGFWYFLIGQLVLRAKPKIPPSALELISLTRTGREVASILPVASDMEIVDAVAEHIRGAVESMDCNRIIQGDEETGTFETIKIFV